MHQAWGTWVTDHIFKGWEGYIITFMFDHIPGRAASQIDQMEKEVVRVYRTLLTRIVRRPQQRCERDRLPRWIVVPDFPVPKHAKTSLGDVTINGGLHMHAIALLPPTSRLTGGLDQHFAAHQALYVRPGFPLCRLHAEPILRTPGTATEYVLKSIRRGRVSGDQILLLPQDRASHIFE
ncbi:hypothetical protein [Antarcticirhabdus aurantiaca]|uniref:Uncharacterized protein n=1 Tax=Antarcticirhabdus aurantiaca TaxID=2606717 RepID=A0ACD4NME0_9HYPH|nr:hypothetical protein [Antarcticirhabdus aurantiaca]WAJ27857.1 hypothetical protein OXU80_23930 [Jeongeuplla avenae]